MYHDAHPLRSQGALEFEGDRWQRDLSPQGLRFVQALMTRDPAARPSAAEALKHPWLTELQPIRPPTKQAVEEAPEAAPEAKQPRDKSTFRRMQITWSWS